MLEVAGLRPTEESVYVTLLNLPPVTVSEAYQACSTMSRTEVCAVLDALTDKGLLTYLPGRPRRYAPVAPEAALEASLAKREEELRQARAAVSDLTERYRAVPRQTATDELAEIVTGKRRTWQRWNAASRCGLSMTSPGCAARRSSHAAGPRWPPASRPGSPPTCQCTCCWSTTTSP